MFEFQSKIKRQIEIIGLCLSNDKSNPISVLDVADIFGVEELTIKRDLQDLRSYGIDIHSSRKRGITLEANIDENKLTEIILHYNGLSHKEYSLDKSTSLLVNKLGVQSLTYMVIMQRCIDNCLKAKIDYIKEGNEIDKGRIIEPILIFQSGGCWRVLAQHEDSVRQFLFDKILTVKATDKTFIKITNSKLTELFAYSWKSWIGFEKHNIKLILEDKWADRLGMRTFLPDQKVTRLDCGSIMFEATVNSLDEIASWIVSRGKGVKVLEPETLKEKVISLAKGALENY